MDGTKTSIDKKILSCIIKNRRISASSIKNGLKLKIEYGEILNYQTEFKKRFQKKNKRGLLLWHARKNSIFLKKIKK